MVFAVICFVYAKMDECVWSVDVREKERSEGKPQKTRQRTKQTEQVEHAEQKGHDAQFIHARTYPQEDGGEAARW